MKYILIMIIFLMPKFLFAGQDPNAPEDREDLTVHHKVIDFDELNNIPSDSSYYDSLKLQISASQWIGGAKNLDILLGVNDKLEGGMTFYSKDNDFKVGFKANYFIKGDIYSDGWYVMGSVIYKTMHVEFNDAHEGIVDKGYLEGLLAVYYQLAFLNHFYTAVGAGYHFKDEITPYFNWNIGVSF